MYTTALLPSPVQPWEPKLWISLKKKAFTLKILKFFNEPIAPKKKKKSDHLKCSAFYLSNDSNNHKREKISENILSFSFSFKLAGFSTYTSLILRASLGSALFWETIS